VLLDRRKVKFWQRIVFGGMAFLMAAFLVVGYSGVLEGCDFMGAEESATDQIDQEVARGEAAVKADPKDATAWASLGAGYVERANMQAQGSEAQLADWQKATVAYRRAGKLLAKQKGQAVKQQRLDVLEQLVSVQLFMQDYQAATSTYGEITGLRPKDAQSYFDMATVAISAGDTNTALLAFTRFLELDPESADAPAVKDWIEQNAPSPAPTKGSGQ
jgi:cytochrome c-type biogenesis protein CcmH/NrfG